METSGTQSEIHKTDTDAYASQDGAPGQRKTHLRFLGRSASGKWWWTEQCSGQHHHQSEQYKIEIENSGNLKFDYGASGGQSWDI